MNSIIILADLGRMKAYRITRDDLQAGASPAFGDLADVELENQHSKVSERMSDKAGRFAYGAGSKSVGERQSEQEESEGRQLEGIVKAIHKAAGIGNEDIYLAAPKEIIADLVDSLDRSVVRRIFKQLSLNLVKTPKLDLLESFEIK